MEKVKSCAQGVALGAGATVEISRYASRCLNRVCNPALSKLLKQNWEQLGLTIEEPPSRSYGSTDMGSVSQEVSALHAHVAIAPKGRPHRSEAFRTAARSEKGHEGRIYGA